jgi:hypothetical protein
MIKRFVAILVLTFIITFNCMVHLMNMCIDETDYIVYGVTHEGIEELVEVYDQEAEAQDAEFKISEQYKLTYYVEATM